MDFHGAVDKTKTFFTKLGRRNIIIICSVALICTAVYLNWRFFSESDPGTTDPGVYSNGAGDVLAEDSDSGSETVDPVASYFAASQISRQRARDEAMEVLQNVAASGEADEAVKNQALEDISRIALDIERESNIESLVLSKGFEQCVAIVNGGSANVIVKCDLLLPNQMAQIYEIVYEQTGIEPLNVRIIPKAEA